LFAGGANRTKVFLLLFFKKEVFFFSKKKQKTFVNKSQQGK